MRLLIVIAPENMVCEIDSGFNRQARVTIMPTKPLYRTGGKEIGAWTPLCKKRGNDLVVEEESPWGWPEAVAIL